MREHKLLCFQTRKQAQFFIAMFPSPFLKKITEVMFIGMTYRAAKYIKIKKALDVNGV